MFQLLFMCSGDGSLSDGDQVAYMSFAQTIPSVMEEWRSFQKVLDEGFESCIPLERRLLSISWLPDMGIMKMFEELHMTPIGLVGEIFVRKHRHAMNNDLIANGSVSCEELLHQSVTEAGISHT